MVEVVPNEIMVWLVTESTLGWLQQDKHEWTNTKMIFEIIPKGDKVLLRFTHHGLLPGPGVLCHVCEGLGFDY